MDRGEFGSSLPSKEKARLSLRLISRCVGQLESPGINPVRVLSLPQVKELASLMLEWQSQDDLVNWLQP